MLCVVTVLLIIFLPKSRMRHTPMSSPQVAQSQPPLMEVTGSLEDRKPALIALLSFSLNQPLLRDESREEPLLFNMPKMATSAFFLKPWAHGWTSPFHRQTAEAGGLWPWTVSLHCSLERCRDVATLSVLCPTESNRNFILPSLVTRGPRNRLQVAHRLKREQERLI